MWFLSRWWCNREEEQTCSWLKWSYWRRKYWKYAFSWNGTKGACFFKGFLQIFKGLLDVPQLQAIQLSKLFFFVMFLCKVEDAIVRALAQQRRPNSARQLVSGMCSYCCHYSCYLVCVDCQPKSCTFMTLAREIKEKNT